MDGRVSYFDDIFILFFYDNGDGVLLNTRLKTPTKTVLEAVLFMYILTNTNSAVIYFFADYGHGVRKVLQSCIQK